MVARESSNVAWLFRDAVARFGDRPALIERVGDGDRTTTFAELDRRAGAVAALLAARGVAADDGVLFFAAPARDLYAALIAVFRLGAVALFVEPSAGWRLVDDACLMWSPKALVASPRAHLLRLVSRRVRDIPLKLVTDGWVPGATPLGGTMGVPSTANDVVHRDASAPALLTFTSGSTGRPKGAVRTHGILRAQLDALRSLAARAGERELVSLPIVVLINLASGATTVLPDADLRQPSRADGPRLAEQIRRCAVSRMTVSPALLERIAAAARTDVLEELETIVTGGGPVFPDIVRSAARAAPRSRVVSVFGSTEAEPIAHIGSDEVSEAEVVAMTAGAGLLVGRPDPAVALAVLPNRWGTPLPPMTAWQMDRERLPPGEAGEIVVAGAHVVEGYLHGRGDDETKFRVDARVWHRTGDVGRLDERGRLWLLGRASAVITDARGTAYPFAVESALRASFVGIRVALLGHRGRRVLLVEDGSHPLASVEQHVRDAMSWAHVDGIIRVGRLPLDRRHNSKVDYAAARRLIGRGA